MGRLAIIIVCVVAVAIVVARLTFRAATSEEPGSEHDGLVCITPHRVPMAAEVAVLCINPQARFGPHMEAGEVHIYANQVAIEYRRAQPNEHDYPIGSKFVKEKYKSAGDDKPDIATIMERIKAHSDVSDWNFSIVSLPDKTELHPSSEVGCAECHQRYRDTGYISDVSEATLRKYLKIE